MQNNELVYKYTISWKMAIFMLLIGSVLSVFSFDEASSNTQGMSINGIIEFGTTGANIFLWCIFSIMLFVTLLSVYSIYEIILGKTTLVLSGEGLLFPTGPFKKGDLLMSYKEISDLGFKKMNGVQFLTFRHNGKERLVVAARFKTEELFNEFTNEFNGRVEAAHQQGI